MHFLNLPVFPSGVGGGGGSGGVGVGLRESCRRVDGVSGGGVTEG